MSDISDLWPHAFPDPDKIGQSEYRAIHDCISDGLEEIPIGIKREHALAMLTEIQRWAKEIEKELRK